MKQAKYEISKRVLVLTGAGISAESGISTFRDSDGLWEQYSIEEVCTPEALERNPKKVFDFYNMRRNELLTIKPNLAHYTLAEMEQEHDVTILTTNVDNLHESAGSTNVIHIHGELLKARDMVTDKVYDWVTDINVGTLSDDGNQLRPHIVFFNEDVPMIKEVENLIRTNFYDYLLVVGTSLEVYPAANILNMVKEYTKILLVDVKRPNSYADFVFFKGKATEQLPIIREALKVV